MAPGSSTSPRRRPTDEREEKEKKAGGTCAIPAYSPWNKDATVFENAEMLRCENYYQFLPDFRTTENVRQIPSQVATSIVRLVRECRAGLRLSRARVSIPRVGSLKSPEKVERRREKETSPNRYEETQQIRRTSKLPFVRGDGTGIMPRDKNCNNEGCAG